MLHAIPLFTQSILHQLKKCRNLNDLGSAYASIFKQNLDQNCFLVNQFITACSALGCLDYGVLAFTQVRVPNVFVYNAMIKAFVNCFKPCEAIECYRSMIGAAVEATSYTFPSVVKACVLGCVERTGGGVHGRILKSGFECNVFVLTSLVEFYSKVGCVDYAGKVFDEMPDRDVFAWSTMVSAYVHAGDMNSARRVFDVMPERSTASWNPMIDGYSKLGRVKDAEELFLLMPSRDLISWTAMINCYSQNKQFREALAVFDEMRGNGIVPDEVTMVTAISACAHLGALDIGKEIHFFALRNGFDIDVYLGSALIDMYAKCGCLNQSLVVFLKLKEKNLFCWNAVIDALAAHGYGNEALRMFTKMVKEKIQPNGITFISVLSACSHAGLVEEGTEWFSTMTRAFSISPQVEHYGCMIDLFCKAGLLEDALDLMRNMAVEPNSRIWSTLLSGCKLHKNLKIAHVAAEKLMTLEPSHSGPFNLLVSMYAEVNRWDEVAKIRAAMKGRGIEKSCPGSSWIELEKQVHQFAASEKTHVEVAEIWSSLNLLYGQLKEAGREPELEFISD
uniref:Chlororespiratory reduction 4 n=1 Tax=Kalanchoe fedtschenkoi TaxID=63787 RepID=A0A7N0UJV8_KALFE